MDQLSNIIFFAALRENPYLLLFGAMPKSNASQYMNSVVNANAF